MLTVPTAISESPITVPSVEFLGTTFAERREALRRINQFRELAEQAMLDAVARHIDMEVDMVFFPSAVVSRRYPHYSVPCYSLLDDNPIPLHEQVTIRTVNDEHKLVVVTQGKNIDNHYDRSYRVDLGSIVDFTPIDVE